MGELDEAVRSVNDLRSVGQQLTGWDAATWRTSSGDRAMRSTVVAVSLFKSTPDWGRLRARFDRLTLMVPVLRQRPLFGAVGVSSPRLAVDPHFDLDIHLRRYRLPGDAGWSEVLAEARRMSLTDFDHARPLWEAVLVEGLPDGQAALIVKLHHSIADGQAAVLIGLNLFEFTPQGTPNEPEAPAAPEGSEVSVTSVSRANIQDNVTRAFDFAVNGVKVLADLAIGTVKSPVETWGDAVTMAGSLGRFASVPEAALSPVMSQRSDMYRFGTFELPFDRMKAAAKRNGRTVNDLFLGSVTTGLAAYHERHGQPVEQLRFNIPISLRQTVKDGSASNAVTIARFVLPVNGATLAERIEAAHEEVRRWREEPALALANPLAEASWLLPVPLLVSAARASDITVSNVPGPPVPIYLAGAEVAGTWPLVPTVGAAANITLVTYNRIAFVGVSADEVAVPDLEDLIADLRSGFDTVIEGGEADGGLTSVPGDGHHDEQGSPASTAAVGAATAKTAAKAAPKKAAARAKAAPKKAAATAKAAPKKAAANAKSTAKTAKSTAKTAKSTAKTATSTAKTADRKAATPTTAEGAGQQS